MRINKPMIIMLICVLSLVGVIVLYKVVGSLIFKRIIANIQLNAKITVSTMKVEKSEWQPKVRASGSVRAINGVNVTTQLAGMVQSIYFTPGSEVEKGEKLVQLNADTEIGTMQSLQAQVELAKITYERDLAQYKIHAVSLQTVQTDEQNLRSLQGQLASQVGTVEKKMIVAPFSGHIGINYINLGQYINPGDRIASLQSLDPIYVDFYVPQQQLAAVRVGQSVSGASNAHPERRFTGKITTIDASIDTVSRNVLVEATVQNKDKLLTPGMFTTVEVSVGQQTPFITVPQTAISFNSFGDLVYIVTESKDKDSDGKPILVANQSFVKLGETRGDQVAVLSGLKEGDIVVTSGQLKLKNGAHVTINNSVQPANNPNPNLPNEY